MQHRLIRLPRLVVLSLAATVVSLPVTIVAAKARSEKKAKTFKTAPPPKFTDDVRSTFFDDARQKLGPGQPGGVVATAAPKAGGAGDEADASSAPAGDAAW